MITVTVATGDTLSGIAASHDVSLSSVEAANPQVENPNLIYPGDKVVVPAGGSFAQWNPPSAFSATSRAPLPGTSSASPAGMSPGTAAFTSGGLGDVPGVPVSYATCVAQRESSDNPRAVNSIPGYVGNGGGAYGFLTSTWQGMGAITAGYAQPFDAPVAVQKAAFAALYKQDGTSPWSPSDHC